MYKHPWVTRKPIRSERAMELLKPSIDAGHYTNGGPAVNALEKYIKEILHIPGTHEVQLTSSGTSALHSLISAYNIYFDKLLRWVTQGFTFPSAVLGPLKDTLIVDNDRIHKGPSFTQLEDLKDSFDGVIVTNVFGTLVDTQAYLDWAKENGKLIIFDNAATPMSFVDGNNSCGFGDGAIISFHETKAFGRGEGGCICAPLFLKQSLERSVNFGFDYGMDVRVRHHEASNWRMSDIAAVFIHARLELLNPETIKHAHQLNREAHRFMEDSDYLNPLFPLPLNEEWFVSCICVICPIEVDISAFSKEYSIEAKKYYFPLEKKELLPIAWEWYTYIICLPFEFMRSREDLMYCLKSLETFVKKSMKK